MHARLWQHQRLNSGGLSPEFTLSFSMTPSLPPRGVGGRKDALRLQARAAASTVPGLPRRCGTRVRGCMTWSPSQWVHFHSHPHASSHHLSQAARLHGRQDSAPNLLGPACPGMVVCWRRKHLRSEVIRVGIGSMTSGTHGTHLHLGNEEPQPLQWRLVRGSNELTQAQSPVPEARDLFSDVNATPYQVGSPG